MNSYCVSQVQTSAKAAPGFWSRDPDPRGPFILPKYRHGKENISHTKSARKCLSRGGGGPGLLPPPPAVLQVHMERFALKLNSSSLSPCHRMQESVVCEKFMRLSVSTRARAAGLKRGRNKPFVSLPFSCIKFVKRFTTLCCAKAKIFMDCCLQESPENSASVTNFTGTSLFSACRVGL